MPPDKKKISNMLEEAGLVSEDQISKILNTSEESADMVSTSSLSMQTYVSEEDLLQTLAADAGFEFVRLYDLPVNNDLLPLIPSSVARDLKVFPVRKEGDALVVAMSDPLNISILDDLRLFLGSSVDSVISPEEDILDAIDRYYGSGDESLDEVINQIESQDDTEMDLDDDDSHDLTSIKDEVPVIKFVNLMLLQAIKDQASDLHVEPFEESIQIRYRVDGVLREIPSPPKQMQLGICSRLKVMADMDIAETRRPQDGRIKLSLSGKHVDIRVSTLPTVWGESIVMRILDKDMMMIGMEQIGLDPSEMEKLDPVTKMPNGIILVTGPTGCGKTTTLYAVLSRIYNDELKIITTEDPVEYQLDGVVQVNINAGVGLTFASCLRAILRQDPDIIMVGEIRDLETAQISIQSALTGHLVLSTIHTNDAPSTITRLIDMDIEAFLLASTLEAVVAQRLVRTICPSCKEVYQPEPELLEEFGKTPKEAEDVVFYQGKGCDDCNFSGFRGRIGIFEILTLNEELRDLIIDRVSTNILASAAKKYGFSSMREDGWRKIVNGLTTIDEVMRQTHMDTVSDEEDEFGEAELAEKQAALEAQSETIEITDSEVKGIGPEDAAKL